MYKCIDDPLKQIPFKVFIHFIINITNLLTSVIALCIRNLFGVNLGASFPGGQ